MKKRTSFFLNAPYIIWALLFILIPLIFVVIYSITDDSGSLSFENIGRLASPVYLKSFGISALFSLGATLIALLVAYPFAYIMSRSSKAVQGTMMTLVMLPLWMNMLILISSWANIIETNGIINVLLSSLGLPKLDMMGTPGAVILGMVYSYLPYMILPIYSSMIKIGSNLLEAAEDLGANSFEKLIRVILPLSMPGVISGVIMVFVPAISTFYISYKLGDGKYQLIGDIIEAQVKNYNYHFAAALSLVLMIIIIISVALTNKFTGDDDNGGVIF